MRERAREGEREGERENENMENKLSRQLEQYKRIVRDYGMSCDCDNVIKIFKCVDDRELSRSFSVSI